MFTFSEVYFCWLKNHIDLILGGVDIAIDEDFRTVFQENVFIYICGKVITLESICEPKHGMDMLGNVLFTNCFGKVRN